jgi:hypothetical protein
MLKIFFLSKVSIVTALSFDPAVLMINTFILSY